MLYIKTIVVAVLAYLISLPEWVYVATYLIAAVSGVLVCGMFMNFNKLLEDSKGISEEFDNLGCKWKGDEYRINIFNELKFTVLAQLSLIVVAVVSNISLYMILLLFTFGVFFCSTRYLEYVSDFYMEDLRKVRKELDRK